MLDTLLPLRLAISDFGEEIIIEDGSVTGATVMGLFDKMPDVPTMFDQGVESTAPMLVIPAADIPEDLIEHGTRLWADEDYYQVTGVERIKGELRLTLRELDHG